MRTKAAVEFFGGKVGIRKALPEWTKGAIYLWGETVPLRAALQLQLKSGGQLPVDMSLYDQAGRIIRTPPSHNAA